MARIRKRPSEKTPKKNIAQLANRVQKSNFKPRKATSVRALSTINMTKRIELELPMKKSCCVKLRRFKTTTAEIAPPPTLQDQPSKETVLQMPVPMRKCQVQLVRMRNVLPSTASRVNSKTDEPTHTKRKQNELENLPPIEKQIKNKIAQLSTTSKIRKCRVKLVALNVQAENHHTEINFTRAPFKPTNNKVDLTNVSASKISKFALSKRNAAKSTGNKQNDIDETNIETDVDAVVVTNNKEAVELSAAATKTNVRHCQVNLLRIPLPETRINFALTEGGQNVFKKLSFRQPDANSTPIRAKLRNLKHFQPITNSTINAPPSQKNAVDDVVIVDMAQELVEEDKQETAIAKNSSAPVVVPHNTHKFLHRDNNVNANIHSSATVAPKENNNNIVKKKMPIPRRKNGQRVSKRLKPRTPSAVGGGGGSNNVYDFLSESKTSDSERVCDPAADIIRRMIDSGKVRVATTRKGTGRPTIKRIKNKAAAPAKKKVVAKKRTMKQQATVAVPDVDENLIFDDDEAPPLPEQEEEDEAASTSKAAASVTHARGAHQKPKDISPEGTFSRLARSVLIQQLTRQSSSDVNRKRFTDQRKLLEVAHKFVSTPVQKKSLGPSNTSLLSPISVPMSTSPTRTTTKQPEQQNGNASPWRVDENAHLPSVFNFSRNSANVQSFSSDFILATPKKPNHQNNGDNNRQTVAHESSYIGLRNDTPMSSPPSFERSMIYATPMATSFTSSSYSSNDSNAENMPPSAAAVGRENFEAGDANSDIFNSRQFPNPRRVLSNRSPLKTINILEVVHLPSWKSPAKEPPQLSSSKSPPSQNSSDAASDQNSIDGIVEAQTKVDLLGFEEFLADDEIETQPAAAPSSTNTNNLKSRIGVNLHELRRLRPANDEITPSAAGKPISNVCHIYEERPKQRCIKDMLCSTMIDPKNRKKMHTEFGVNRNDSEKEKLGNTAVTDDISDLFQEPEPEISLNEKNLHRTYVRPSKRKRKIRHNFNMLLDSDDEAEVHNSPEKDNDAEKKKKFKTSAELNRFIIEFNDMCREVETYEIVVEKSAKED